MHGIFPMGEKNEAYAKYFVGQSYLNMLSTQGVAIGNVTFEPGCRNNWHIHHKGGQILLVTGGRGYYQAWGETPRELHPGDVVHIPPEVKHWARRRAHELVRPSRRGNSRRRSLQRVAGTCFPRGL